MDDISFLNLQEMDSLEATVIIDNELDPMSPAAPETVRIGGQMASIALRSDNHITDRGDASKELRMGDICCAAHGLSILVTATKGETKHSVLFDIGPEEDSWERNVKRLRPDLASIEVIQLSHWHRDHSGGLLRAIRMIKEAKSAQGRTDDLIVDLHPDRPVYRGIAFPQMLVSLEADPTFEEISDAGGIIEKHSEAHTILDDMFLVSGEIPRVTPYETGLKGAVRFDPGTKDWYSDELIIDERFLAVNLKGKGIVVFTGCSHGGVVNASKHAMKFAPVNTPLHCVVGGFHLATSEESQIQSTVADLKRLDPAVLMPGHCSGWRSKFAIEKAMPGTLVPCTVGINITF
ncbi:uncharacterized protein N7483_007690 [Penicillium malachiteum]|uniref:uncharacterized protein n=1 Tax=Penicillium malachiteum TaxID=1324776 RepID=UPI002547E547|nr:uncharacterized protein N7483_007690 [Penicillium malachiteum]KAJ5726333.1 hypothetical protein N7483_007690 [Penicillium malachiteum]